MLARVEGGTGAGKKRPLADRPASWKCACGQTHPGYWTKCPDTALALGRVVVGSDEALAPYTRP